jgi:hypothetical protein
MSKSKKYNLKLLMDEILYDDSKLLVCGGAGGHMRHPYEKYETPEELLNFFRDFLTGKFGGTEKVDGYNLFVGYDDNGDVVAVRNKNQPPIKDINKKFDLSHAAFEGFTAGWKAIKSKLQQLSYNDRVKYKLIEENSDPLNFINLEILFGYIPNVVPYSKTTNYIVFHGLAGAPQTDWYSNVDNEKKLLTNLANKLKNVSVTSPRIKYKGEVGKVERKAKTVESYWEFKGPIKIRKEEIKSELQDVYQEWQTYPEVKELIQFAKKRPPAKDTPEFKEYSDKRFELMKKVTKRIGSEVLKNMVSKLSDTGAVIAGHPGMEGIALDIEGDLVKITGDFLDFSKPEDIPALDATKDIREYIQKDVLGMNVKTLSALKDKSKKGLINFVLERRKKKYNYDIDEPIGEHKQHILKLINIAQENIKDTLKIVRDKGREYDEKSLLVQSYLLSTFATKLKDVEIYEELIEAYGEVFYNIKR